MDEKEENKRVKRSWLLQRRREPNIQPSMNVGVYTFQKCTFQKGRCANSDSITIILSMK